MSVFGKRPYPIGDASWARLAYAGRALSLVHRGYLFGPSASDAARLFLEEAKARPEEARKALGEPLPAEEVAVHNLDLNGLFADRSPDKVARLVSAQALRFAGMNGGLPEPTYLRGRDDLGLMLPAGLARGIQRLAFRRRRWSEEVGVDVVHEAIRRATVRDLRQQEDAEREWRAVCIRVDYGTYAAFAARCSLFGKDADTLLVHHLDDVLEEALAKE